MTSAIYRAGIRSLILFLVLNLPLTAQSKVQATNAPPMFEMVGTQVQIPDVLD